jgi:hypothetical protein
LSLLLLLLLLLLDLLSFHISMHICDHRRFVYCDVRFAESYCIEDGRAASEAYRVNAALYAFYRFGLVLQVKTLKH